MRRFFSYWLVLLAVLASGPANAQTPTAPPTDSIRATALLQRADSLRLAQARQRIGALRATTPGFPVVLRTDTLFRVYTKLGPFSPRERVALIAEKVQRLEANPDFRPDSLRLYPAEQTIDLMYGELVVQSVSETDALWAGVPRDALAQQYRARIVQAVARYREAHRFSNVLKEIGLVLLVLVAFYFVVRLVNRLFGWVRAKLLTKETTWFRAVRVNNYELFTPRRGWRRRCCSRCCAGYSSFWLSRWCCRCCSASSPARRA